MREKLWILAACTLLGVFTGMVIHSTNKHKPKPVPIVQKEDKAEVYSRVEPQRDPIRVTKTADEYLCDVYKRTPEKRDASGDFTWKDQAAARRLGMDVCTYAIGGMSPELKERLVTFGQAADEKGIEWSMLAGFRDDYRQSIASGLKARTGNSVHGNSRATKGYGHGRAVDIVPVKGSAHSLFSFLDIFGPKIGLVRPYKGFDPNHVQLASYPRYEAPERTKVAKVKHKVRYAKKVKHRTRVAVSEYRDDRAWSTRRAPSNRRDQP